METLRAIMTSAISTREPTKGSRFGVLGDDSEKLRQPLIASREGPSYNCYYDYEPLGDEEAEAMNDSTETDGLLGHSNNNNKIKIEESSSSSAEMLRSIVANVLWPMTPVGSQVAKAFETRNGAPVVSSARVEERNALHTVTTLQSMTKPRRRSETVEDIHERALARIAGITLFFSAWLIISVYRATGEP